MVYIPLKNILCLDQPYATRVLVFLMYLTVYFIVNFNLIVGIEPQLNHNLLLLLASLIGLSFFLSLMPPGKKK